MNQSVSTFAEPVAATNFSFLRGASPGPNMVLTALLLGHGGIGIADRNTVAGVVRAWAALKHLREEGIPSPDKILKKGDIVNIDVAVNEDGWFGDTSRMFFVGEPGVLARRLVETTYEAMRAGIRQVRPGATLGDIGHAIQAVAQRERFSVVREYCGHGIGQVYHEKPDVLHYGQCGEGLRLEAGMVFTIEPMLNAGLRDTRTLADGWTVVTKDRSLSAQWEHMVAVTPEGYEVLTGWPDGTGAYAAV